MVTNFTESELRAAVDAGNRVTFGGSGTILLSQPITVTNTVVVDGSNALVQIRGQGTTRMFNVATNARLTLKNLSLLEGRATNGGAICSSGTLQVQNCSFERNSAVGQSSQAEGEASPGHHAAGGAIYSLGELIVSNCTFTRNRAAGEPGWLQGGLALGRPRGSGQGRGDLHSR